MRDKGFQRATKIFLKKGGILRMSEAVARGISRKTLYAMRDQGVLTQLTRGVYRLTTLAGLEAQDLVTVSTRVSKGVICLISALALHELTTQVPHAVDIAIARGAKIPRIEYPPIHVYWFSGKAFNFGIETPLLDGRRIRIYSAEKSVADAFKYRNTIGMDVALESLRMWCSRRNARVEKLLEYAGICRVERVIRPYLQAMI